MIEFLSNADERSIQSEAVLWTWTGKVCGQVAVLCVLLDLLLRYAMCYALFLSFLNFNIVPVSMSTSNLTQR